MPAGIKSSVENGQRPSPSDQRQMIRILADEMKKHDTNPTRSQCLTVTRIIVSQYPKSFADMMGDKQVGDMGYESVLSQLKVRIEPLNRISTQVIIGSKEVTLELLENEVPLTRMVVQVGSLLFHLVKVMTVLK
ncbi:hypothetical protein PO909_010712 [Leuciscus waleckii]